jgi:hypothetical protein
MNLYIRLTSDGSAFEHPILEDNLLQALPGFDVNNLPPGFARFVRVPQPTGATLGPFDQWVCTYTLMEDGSTYTDVWTIQTVSTDEQTLITQQQIASNNTTLTNKQISAQSVIASMNETVDNNTRMAWSNYIIALGSVDLSDPFNVNWPVTPVLPTQADDNSSNSPSADNQ